MGYWSMEKDMISRLRHFEKLYFGTRWRAKAETIIAAALFAEAVLLYGCGSTPPMPNVPYPAFDNKQFGTIEVSPDAIELYLPREVRVTVMVPDDRRQLDPDRVSLQKFWVQPREGDRIGQPEEIRRYLYEQMLGAVGRVPRVRAVTVDEFSREKKTDLAVKWSVEKAEVIYDHGSNEYEAEVEIEVSVVDAMNNPVLPEPVRLEASHEKTARFPGGPAG